MLISPVGNQAGLDLAALFPQWMQWLPLNGDEDEARATHARLMTLVEQQNAAVLGDGLANLPALVRIFRHACQKMRSIFSEYCKSINRAFSTTT